MICFIGGLGLSEVLVIALVVLLFFGGKKIPELMKGLGKGVRSFKDGMKEVQSGLDDDSKEETKKEEEKK
ncbi:MAG: twin-arginine translocase TatA/TatE family subunit [Muribaculaceae bacterium]|nr:twin-arginine translocase TatA/TatE family subunit [Muribaculaceae bacterium]